MTRSTRTSPRPLSFMRNVESGTQICHFYNSPLDVHQFLELHEDAALEELARRALVAAKEHDPAVEEIKEQPVIDDIEKQPAADDDEEVEAQLSSEEVHQAIEEPEDDNDDDEADFTLQQKDFFSVLETLMGLVKKAAALRTKVALGKLTYYVATNCQYSLLLVDRLQDCLVRV
ncbi:hypothetical protein FOPE_10798 [Fonsecaea pedrosoi]|nr:hypothetical protein FOPE_10798 [Fonsecaea pedrosoi]